MKTFVFILCLLFAARPNGHAQPVPHPVTSHNKPRLFTDLPSRLNIRLSDCELLLQRPVGANVQATIADGLVWNGRVVSKSQDGQPYQTIVVRSTDRQGATFVFTKTTDDSGVVRFRARIVSLAHADAFTLVVQEGRYYFIKQNLDEIVTE